LRIAITGYKIPFDRAKGLIAVALAMPRQHGTSITAFTTITAAKITMQSWSDDRGNCCSKH
jgi:hypothetical protein